MKVETLQAIMGGLTTVEEAFGGRIFMGRPDRWHEGGLERVGPQFRCTRGHVSVTILKTDRGDRCLAADCRQPVVLTFPEDRDGPLLAALAEALGS